MTPTMQMFQEGPQFSDRIRSASIDGVMFFSVLDIFKHYSDSKNVARSWKATETFLIKQGAIKSGWEKGSDTQNVSLRMHRFDGQGQRDTPAGTFKMIMRIGQVTTFKEWEPMRDWMAGLAQERIEEAANPSLGIQRAQDRFLSSKMNQGMDKQEAEQFLVLVQEGHIIRRQWTDVLKRVVVGAIGYGTITNAEYEVLFGMTAKQISLITGFSPARDGMTKTGRQIVNTVECALEDEFNRHARLTFTQAVVLAKQVCAEFRPVIESVQSRTGIELATGKPLLTAGSAS
jgi:hypothetical protein